MKIHETLDRDPKQIALANNGQARISETRDERTNQELRAELETFVCDGQYGDALERILQSFLTQLDRPRQNAAWVSGFFGSGKSHLLKMLGHLWVDTAFPDGSTARSLVAALPDEITALLRELDTRAARTGKPCLTAAGSLPAGTSDHVRSTVLAILLRACNLPEQYPQAQFCFWLREHGYLDRVRVDVEKAGKNWLRELNNLYASSLLAKAVLACDPKFAPDETAARQTLRARFPLRTTDINTAEFIAAAREALAPDGKLPLTMLILDEVQQYIGESTDRAVLVTELAEAVQTQLDSRVMLVASGQSALSGTTLLQKLRDRFRIAVQLSDADVEAVTRKVLLNKKASAVESVRRALERSAGEVSRHLQGSRLAERTEDREIVVEDYPLLPTRRRFWEHCFKVVDAPGTHSQLRSQLRIVYDALRDVADRDLGAVIPGDALYDAIAPDLVHSGVLLNEISSLIAQLDDRTDRGRLRRRICSLVFLVSKLPREEAVDVGLRADARAIADLLVDDLATDSGPLRQKVATELAALVDEGKLMKVGEEFRLQTTEGAEWDRAFRERCTQLQNDDADLAVKREQLLAAEVQKVAGEIRLNHGESKERRALALHVGSGDPPVGTDQVVVWLRDGWSTAQKDVESEARRLGLDSAIVHVFLQRSDADRLKARMIEAEAARRVIDHKGPPSTEAGRVAKESVASRLAAAEQARGELVRGIVTAAKVYQGGGTEVFGDNLLDKLRVAAEASLVRLFPRFAEADHRAWEAAMKRARDGNEQSLKLVGWEGPTEDHPVAREVLAQVGTGRRGNDLRKVLKASPYGWPQDAIDAVLIALHRFGTLRATQNGAPVAPGHLEQARISATDFAPERVRLSVKERIQIRGLFQKAGVGVRAGEEETKAGAFLKELRALAAEAGGEPPLPPCPSTTRLDDLSRLVGGEQLAGILKAQAELEQALDAWKAKAELAKVRLPKWQVLERLLRHAESLEVAAQLRPEVDAIRTGRTLLDETDRVTPLQQKLATALRGVLTQEAKAYASAYEVGSKSLAGDAAWKGLQPAEQAAVLSRVQLAPPRDASLRTAPELLAELDRESITARAAATAAVPERIGRALAEVARKQEPEALRLNLRTATLRSEAEVKAWLAEQEQRLLQAVARGPVIVP